MKQKAFAAAVSREDIQEGAALLDIPLADHITHCIFGIQRIGEELDLLPPDSRKDAAD